MNLNQGLKDELQRAIDAFEEMETIASVVPSTDATVSSLSERHNDKARDFADLIERNKEQLAAYVELAYPPE